MRARSRPSSDDNDLPTNVSDETQLHNLPIECLASCRSDGCDNEGNDGGDDDDGVNEKTTMMASRPLRYVDDAGNEICYSLKPMRYSVIFILLVELFERFSYYGIIYTQTLFLTGAYNKEWNAGFDSVQAASFVSASSMISYTTPFIGAYLSDSWLGDYHTLMMGLFCFYIPGVFLIVLTTIPRLFGDEFSNNLLTIAFLFLWPLGTGTVKSIVNVFGAKQYHPVLQSSLIESYYVSFYTVINIGGLLGIFFVPVVAQRNIFVAYLIPLSVLIVGGICFLLGTPRYITTQPRSRSTSTSSYKKDQWFVSCGGSNKSGDSASKLTTTTTTTTTLFDIFRICILVVPFTVGYSQMTTTFIIQGTVMSKAFGVFDVASMNSLDVLSVLFFGSITANYMYPYLAKRNMKIPTTYKLAFGSFLGSCAMAWAILVETMIHSTFERTGEQISVLWQGPAYILIGFGEIFAVSTAYEVAFTASPPDKKFMASAVSVFCIGGLPSMICIVLIDSCSEWFTNSHGTKNIEHIEDYVTARVGKYFVTLLSIMVFGVVINILPVVNKYVESMKERAAEFIKNPTITTTSTAAAIRIQQPPDMSHKESTSLLVTTTLRSKG